MGPSIELRSDTGHKALSEHEMLEDSTEEGADGCD
jgi:hypothetical protein